VSGVGAGMLLHHYYCSWGGQEVLGNNGGNLINEVAFFAPAASPQPVVHIIPVLKYTIEGVGALGTSAHNSCSQTPWWEDRVFRGTQTQSSSPQPSCIVITATQTYLYTRTRSTPRKSVCDSRLPPNKQR
jgi:hypothetical protein